MDIKLVVKFEDRNILILEKPWGLVVTTEGKSREKTIEDMLRDEYDFAANLTRSGIVHRLDKGTSGLLLIAKSTDTLIDLKRQFKDRRIYKEYMALIEGDVSFEGEIKAPLVKRNYGIFGKRQVGIGGKEAITCFNLVKKYRHENKVYSLVKIVLKTGRTHQIRAHFSYLGWPLVGDSIYGGKTTLLNRPFLHARKLVFEYPDGKNFEIESDMSEDLLEVIDKLTNG